MLILTRRLNESILVGDNITITVLSVKGHQVRLGVSAPANVAVHREEVFWRIWAAETEKMPRGRTLSRSSTDAHRRTYDGHLKGPRSPR